MTATISFVVAVALCAWIPGVIVAFVFASRASTARNLRAQEEARRRRLCALNTPFTSIGVASALDDLKAKVETSILDLASQGVFEVKTHKHGLLVEVGPLHPKNRAPQDELNERREKPVASDARALLAVPLESVRRIAVSTRSASRSASPACASGSMESEVMATVAAAGAATFGVAALSWIRARNLRRSR